MEKRIEHIIRKIVLTGAESTGKSTLAKELAHTYNTVYVPEYAREYVEKLERPYNYDDIEKIAKKHLENIEFKSKTANQFLFIDTYLIIIKIWFLELYNKCPEWIEFEIMQNKIDLYIVCDTDLPWIYDPVRENSGERRKYLMNRYIYELDNLKYNYIIVSGKRINRIRNAVEAIDSIFNKK